MRGLTHWMVALLLAGAGFSSQPASAYNNDRALERDGQLCTRHLSSAERRYGIPAHLLSAIAVTESGRRHQGLGIQVPWPWSINVEGTPYLFDTKEEAVQAVQKFRAQGKQSIDVGCMQVNLRHHPHAFTSISNAFEPRYNVEYAAKFLRRNYDEAQSWKTAVGYYHSRTPAYAVPYTGRVYHAWHGMTNRLNQSRNNVYASYIKMEGAGQQVVLGSSEAVRERSLKGIQSNQPSEAVAARTSSGSKVIRVTSKEGTKGRHDLTIIRPTSAKAKPAEVALSSADGVSTEASPIVMDRSGEGKAPRSSMRVVKPNAPHVQSDWTNNDARIIRFSE